MRRSLTLSPVTLKEQPIKDRAHLFIGRIGAELSHGQHIRGLCQLVDFVIVGKFKADFHSMDSNRASRTQAALPVPYQTVVYGRHNIIVRLTKGLAGQVKRLIKQGVSRCLGQMVDGLRSGGVLCFVHGYIFAFICRNGIVNRGQTI